MDNLVDLLKDILAGTHGTLGVVTWVILGWIFQQWAKKWGDPTNSTKVLISIAAPFVVVLAVWGLAGWFDIIHLDKVSFNAAITLAVNEVIGSKFWFAIGRKAQSQNNPEARAADNDAKNIIVNGQLLKDAPPEVHAYLAQNAETQSPRGK